IQMATECTQDSVLRFLSERGGKVSNAELIDHFKPFLSGGPPEKAAARDMFKGFVDNVGFVKQENGAKYVVLRKKYRDSVQRRAGEVEDRVPGQGDREPRRDGPAAAPAVSPTGPSVPKLVVSEEREMGNAETARAGKDGTSGRYPSKKNKGKAPDMRIPHIAVTGPSPLPAADEETVFSLPVPEISGAQNAQSFGQGDCNTPKSSRKNFIELMMSSSPQLRRSMVHKNPGSLLARHRDSVRSDSDSASLVSSVDEDSGSVSLDPLEHEWMMCASDGQWESLHRLLACDPNLVAKKDFVTGFTCLHWAAKQGKQELMALLVNFAKQHAVPLNINCRSSAGYTPLHLAAMHDHVEVVKLLVGAYDADVEARDYSGKKPWQYLGGGVDEDIKEIVGASGDSDAENADIGAGRWRLSKVLPSNLMPLKLLNLPEEDVCDVGGPGKAKSVHRKTSMSRIKPRLHKIRFKTQIIHSTSLRETEEGELALKSPGKSRPKSTLFG
uniref:Sosondowah ankyrin repeat domain family Cb n=1 Tax=Lepisosteus oculatus TaxID=7918 RepID=W5MW25_LEPOC